MKTNEPTAAAMRAVSLLAELGYFRDACAANKLHAAEIIDRATGLPELLAACEAMQEWFDDHGPPLGESQAAHGERAIRANLRAAIARAKGGAS